MSTETELKLRIPADQTEAFCQHPVLLSCASSRQQQQLVGTYYDTPDLELLQARVGLRVRREGARWIQTLKSAGSGVGGLHQRHEWEAEVMQNQVDFACLPKMVQESLFADKSLCERIAPIFTSDFQRISWQFERDANCLIEICLDQGEVRQADKHTPICEVELELKRGEPADLLQLALQLQAEFPLVLENISKAQRGYALFQPKAPQVIAPSPPSLSTDLTASGVFAELLRHYLAHLQANEPAALSETAGSGGVRQLCHAAHRLQSGFLMCRKLLPRDSSSLLLDELEWLEQAFQSAYGWDLFNDILEAIELQMGAQNALRELAVTVARRRLQAHQQLAEVLNSARYTRLLLRLHLWLLQSGWRQNISTEAQAKWQLPVADFARKRLSKQHKALRTWSERLAGLHTEALQMLWQDCLHMQALLEFFSDFYAQNKDIAHNKRHSYSDWLAQLSEELGSRQEALVARRLFEEAALDTEHPALHFLQGWYAAKHSLKLGVLEQTWIAFRKQKAFWKKPAL